MWSDITRKQFAREGLRLPSDLTDAEWAVLEPLLPAHYQSGETDIWGKVSRCGHELTRMALYETAHSLLMRSKKWSSVKAWGMRRPIAGREEKRVTRGRCDPENAATGTA